MAYPPRKLAGAFGVEPKATVLETAVLPLHHAPVVSNRDACGRTRTYVVRRRLIYSQVLLLLSHARLENFAIVKNTRAEDEAPLDTLRRTLLLRTARPTGLSQSTEAAPSELKASPALVRTKINSVIKQQKERAFGFDREAGPLLQVS